MGGGGGSVMDSGDPSHTASKEGEKRSKVRRGRTKSLSDVELSRREGKKDNAEGSDEEGKSKESETGRRRTSSVSGAELSRQREKKDARQRAPSKLMMSSASFLAAQKLASEDESEEGSKKSSSSRGKRSSSSRGKKSPVFFIEALGGVKDSEKSTASSTGLSRSPERRRSLSPTFLEAMRYAEEEVRSLTESAKEEEEKDLKRVAEKRRLRLEQQKKLLKEKEEEFAYDKLGYERCFVEQEKRANKELNALIKVKACMESYLGGARPLRFSARVYFETPTPSMEEVQEQLQKINQDIVRRRVLVEHEMYILRRSYRATLEDLFLQQRLFKEGQITSESEMQSDENRELRRRRFRREKNISGAQRNLAMLREREKILTEGSDTEEKEEQANAEDIQPVNTAETQEEENLRKQRMAKERELLLLEMKRKKEEERLNIQRLSSYKGLSLLEMKQKEERFLLGKLHQTRWEGYFQEQESASATSDRTSKGRKRRGRKRVKTRSFTEIKALHQQEIERLETNHQREREEEERKRTRQSRDAGTQQPSGAQTEGPDPARSVDSLAPTPVLTPLEARQRVELEELERSHHRQHAALIQARSSHWSLEASCVERLMEEGGSISGSEEDFFRRRTRYERRQMQARHQREREEENKGQKSQEDEQGAGACQDRSFERGQDDDDEGAAGAAGGLGIIGPGAAGATGATGDTGTTGTTGAAGGTGAAAGAGGAGGLRITGLGAARRASTATEESSDASKSSKRRSSQSSAASSGRLSLRSLMQRFFNISKGSSRTSSGSRWSRRASAAFSDEMSSVASTVSSIGRPDTCVEGRRPSISSVSSSDAVPLGDTARSASSTSLDQVSEQEESLLGRQSRSSSISSCEELLCLLVDQEMSEGSEGYQEEAAARGENASQAAESVSSDISKSEEGRRSSASGECSLDEHRRSHKAKKKRKKDTMYCAYEIISSSDYNSLCRKTRRKKAKEVIKRERMQAQSRLSTSSSTGYVETSTSMELSSSLSLPSEDSDHEKSTGGRQARVSTSYSGVGYLDFHFSSDGEPPENNEAVPDFLFYEHNQDGDTSSEELSVQMDEGNQNITESDEYSIESISAAEDESSSEEESDEALVSEVMPHAELLNTTSDAKNFLLIDYNRAGQEESLRELQQMFSLSMQDMQDALTSLFLQTKIKKQKQERIVSLYASMKRGLDSLHESRNSYGSQVGCIVEASTNSKVGFAYNYAMNRTKDSLKKEKGTAVQGYAKSLVHTHIFSSIVALNSNTLGFTGYLEGSYGIGKIRNNRYVRHKAMFVGTKGHTDIQLIGLSTRMGYALACASWMVLTPYVEANYLTSKGKPYKEQRGFLPAKIVMNKERKSEILMGIDAQVFVYEKIQVHAWLEGVLGKQKHQGMSLDIDNIYAPTISTLAENKHYKNIVLGFSIDTYLTQSFGFGLYSSIKGKHRRVEQGSIGLRTWYDF